MTGERDESMLRTKRILAAVISVLLWISIPAFARAKKPPITLPFAVHMAGQTVSSEVKIVEEGIYPIVLRFQYKDAEDRERVRRLVGDYGRDKSGNLIRPGILISLKLTIHTHEATGERTYLEKELLVGEMFAYGEKDFLRYIDNIKFAPGVYRISVESARDVPELATTPVFLGIYKPRTK